MPDLIVETERTVSRWLTMDDLAEMATMRADPEVARYLGNGEPHTREQVETRMRFYLECYEQYGFGSSGTMLKGDDRLIGCCGLQPLEDTGEIEVGYSFIKPLWRQGFASEVAEGWLRYGFLEHDLQRIFAVSLPLNIGSWKVMEKLGMSFVGREMHYQAECVKYAITRDEFLKTRQLA